MMQQRCFTDAPAGNPPEHFKFRARKGTLNNKKISLLCNISNCLFVFMMKAHKGVKNAFDTGIVLPGIQNM